MKLYRLYVKIDGKWELECSVYAADRDSALRQAILLVKPEHRQKPMNLREEGEDEQK